MVQRRAPLGILVTRKIWFVVCVVGVIELIWLAVLSLGSLTTPYHRSLALLTDLTDQLRSHSVSFEVSKDIISQWVEQPYLEEDGWDAKWEDLCSVEVERWK